MISYAEARRVISEIGSALPLESETIPFTEAPGRIASAEILSPESVPSFDNSAMDGFAVRASETLTASPERPVRLRVSGSTAAGQVPSRGCEPGAAWEIMTGAPMPAGFDSVVKVEDVQMHGAEIELRRSAVAGDHVRKEGEDFQKGRVVFPKGARLGPDAVLALSALGIVTVPVLRKPVVAVLSTGNELVDPSVQRLEPGQIRNSTGAYLAQTLPLMGAEVRMLGVLRDEPDAFEARLHALLEDPSVDLLMTTGAVSMGRYDFIEGVLRKLGARIHFHKVAIRPGKPVLFATLDRTKGRPLAFFGLPGNPVSTAVGLRFFVEPFFRAMRGQKEEPALRARLKNATRKPEGLRCFFKSRLNISLNVSAGHSGEAQVDVLEGQASFMVSSLLQANAWAVLSEEGREVPAGTMIDVFPLYSNGLRTDVEVNAELMQLGKGGCC